ncbi:hypothetical protein, partial [Phenylobacterium sp.]|uniref:hypothetical protein n=1 Tax=Phenylobacterium sp. TaxID=1871053 RepID=UPI002ED7BC26
DAPEYLPRGVAVPDVNDVKWLVPRWRALPRGSAIDVKTPGPVTIGRAAFPIWQVTRDGRAIPSRGPLITFDGAPGRYRVERVTLWQEWLGALISLTALASLVAAITREIRTAKRLERPSN